MTHSEDRYLNELLHLKQRIADLEKRPVPKSTAFSPPIGLQLVEVTDTSVTILWTPPASNLTIIEYRIYRNGLIAGSSENTIFTDTALEPGSSYIYRVTAVNEAGVESLPSESISATTTGNQLDAVPPTTPQGLTVTSLTPQSISLSWQPSTDNVGVISYTVYRQGMPVASPTGTSYNDSTVLPDTTYTYAVDAVDAANNHSGQSTAVLAKTPALPDPGPETGTWYVSPTGTAGGDGSQENPWSLAHALNGAAGGLIEAGHTVWLLGGITYQVSSTLIAHGLLGTAQAPIVFKAYPGARIFIRNQGGVSPFSTLELRDIEYVDFIGLELTMTNYTRTTENPAPTDMYHVTENETYSQLAVRFLGCYFHDSAGRAIGTFGTSDEIEYNGCIFLYNGSNSDDDWTAWLTGAVGTTKTFKDCAFMHSAADLVRIWSDDSTALNGITINGCVFAKPGSLYNDAARAVLIAGETETPTGIYLTENIMSSLGLTPDADSALLQLGHLGSGTGAPTTVTAAPATGSDDGRWTDAGTYSNTNSAIIFGEASGPTFYTAYIRGILNVPQGATITDASLSTWIVSTRTGRTPSIAIVGDKSSVNPTYPTSKVDADARAKTTAVGSYSPGTVTLTAGTELTIPNLAAVIQEIVDQPSWVSGNAIILYLYDDGTSGASSDIQVAAYENTTYTEPVLSVTYTTADLDGGIDDFVGTANYMVGDKVDLDGSGYLNDSFSNNTIIYPGPHVGDTIANYPANSWISAYPSTGQKFTCQVFDWDPKRALLTVFNWSGTSSIVLSASELAGLQISTGDQFELRNLENYWSDVFTGLFNGSSITIDMSQINHAMALPAGAVAKPATLFPQVGIFHLIVLGGGSGEPPPPPPPGDTEAPSVPANVTLDIVSESQIDIGWDASTDNVAVTGYTVYRDNVQIGTTSQPIFSDGGLAGGATYSYQVDAYDAAGNHSTRSAVVQGTTPVPPPPPGGTANWYIGPSGGSSSGTAGDRDNPFSLSYAMNGAAGGRIDPGDTVYILDGTYQYSQLSVDNIAGTSTNPILFMPEPGAKVKFVGTNTGTQNFFLKTVSWVYFYDIEFTVVSTYSRTTTTTSSSPGCHIITGSGEVQTGVKFFGCIFHDHMGMGIKFWEYTAQGIEFNGCLNYYNGRDPQHDHNFYMHNLLGYERLVKDCIVHSPASYNIHCYDDGDRPVNSFTFDGCVFYHTTKLYSGFPVKASVLIGGNDTTHDDGSPVIDEDNTVRDCFFWETASSTPSLKMGYNRSMKDTTVTGNFIVGRPLQASNAGTNYVLNNNKIYASGTNSTTLSRLNAGSGNVIAPIPTSGTDIFVRKYNWGSNKRANVIIYNHASASSVTITNAMLTAQGIDIVAGDTYELINSQDPFNDIITGVYNGTGITVPMTGRTVQTPFGGLAKPASTFPKFGALILKVTS